VYLDKQKPYDAQDVETEWVKWDSCRDKYLKNGDLRKIERSADDFTLSECKNADCTLTKYTRLYECIHSSNKRGSVYEAQHCPKRSPAESAGRSAA
jgi:hypothetical protein